jgi:hypothetical protein
MPISDALQPDVSAQISPAREDPRFPHAERIVNRMKDHWRQQFAARFAEVERAAR